MLSANELYSKFEFTENNHIKYWYEDSEDNLFRQDDWTSTTGIVGYCQRPRLTMRGELIRTTKLISRQHKMMNVFFSGGLDSELALLSWLESRAPFRPVIVRFARELNIDDVTQATEFCVAHKLTPLYIDFDPVAFYESGDWQRVCKEYQSYTFYQQILLKVAENFAEPMITIDEVELEKVYDMDYFLVTGKKKMDWVFIKKEDQDGVWRRFVAKTGIPAYNNFYTYNPETILAFLENRVVDRLINNLIPGKIGWTSSKNEIYAQTDHPFKTRAKRTGVEKLVHLWTEVEYQCTNLLFASEPRLYEFEVNELISNLKQGKVSTCKIA